MAAGEGIETMLSLRQALPDHADGSRHSRPAISPPSCSRRQLRRLYIVRDNDPAGDSARDSLVDRAHEAGIEAIALSPSVGDFNEDLRTSRADALRGRRSRCSSLPRTSAASWRPDGIAGTGHVSAPV